MRYIYRWTFKLFVILGFTWSLAGHAAVLNVSYNVGKGASWDYAANVFKEIIEKESDGKYTVRLHPNAVLAGGNDGVEIEMCQANAIQFIIKGSSWLDSLDSSFGLISLPWLFPDLDTAEYVMSGEAGDLLLDKLANHKLVGLAWGIDGFRQLTNSRRPIESPADLKNLKIRVPGIDMYIDIFRAIGANPTTMSFSEVFTALQTKTVDGQENPLSFIESSHMYEAQEYLTLWNYSSAAPALVASQIFYDGLDDAEREMFKAAAREAMRQEADFVKKQEAELLNKLKENGMKVTELSEEQQLEFKEMLQPVYDSWKKKIGEETVEVFENKVKEYTQ